MIAPRGPDTLRVLGYVGRPLGVLLVFDALVAVAYVCFDQRWLAVPHLPLSIGGGVVGVILGFRNNSCYARWWEARTLCGRIANYSRCLARQAVAFLSGGDSPEDREQVREARRRVVYYQMAYVNAVRCQLRGQEPWAEVAPFLPPEEVESLRGERNAAAAIQRRTAEVVQECLRRGWLQPVHLALIDNSLTELANAQGGSWTPRACCCRSAWSRAWG